MVTVEAIIVMLGIVFGGHGDVGEVALAAFTEPAECQRAVADLVLPSIREVRCVRFTRGEELWRGEPVWPSPAPAVPPR